MSTKLSFGDVLAALASLTPTQLETVEAAARTLRTAGQSRQGSRGKTSARGPASGYPRRVTVSRKAKPSSLATPQRVSGFAGYPEFQQFKTAEKAMHLALRGAGKTLKEANADETLRVSPALADFRTAREAWFRKKAQLKAETSAASAASSATAETAVSEEKTPPKTAGAASKTSKPATAGAAGATPS